MCSTIVAFCIAASLSQLDAKETVPEPGKRPIIECLEIRIHVGTGGRWNLSEDVTFHFDGTRPLQDEKLLAREFTDSLIAKNSTEITLKTTNVRRLEGRKWKGTAKSNNINDMSLLAHVLRESLEIQRDTFSWDRNTFEFAGESRFITSTDQGEEESEADSEGSIHDLKDVIIGFVVMAILSDVIKETVTGLQDIMNNTKLKITTDGTISSTPAEFVDAEAKSLTIDFRELSKLKRPRLSICISDLKLPSGKPDESK